MNKQQRKELETLKDRLISVSAELDSIKDGIEDIQMQESDKYDNAPDNLVDSDCYNDINENAEQLEEVVAQIDDFDVDEIISKIEETINR